MLKEMEELVWPVRNYTQKIFTAMKLILQAQPKITFTLAQMKKSLKKGYFWLVERNKHQRKVLNHLVGLGFQRLTQLGFAKRIKTVVSIERQWVWFAGYDSTIHIDVTGANVACNDEAREACEANPINPQILYRLNNCNLQRA